MKYAVVTGTTSARAIALDTDAAAGEVVFNGDYTPTMIWDAAITNIRAMTAAEIAALPAQQKAARDAAEPDLAAMRDNATSAVSTNTTYLALASPSTVQNTAQIKALTQQNQRIIKALARLIVKAMP